MQRLPFRWLHILAPAAIALATLLPACSTFAQQPADAPQQQGGQGRGRGGMFAGMQRVQGEVTAVNGATLTVKSEDGTVTQIVTTDNTRMMRANAALGAIGGGMGRGMREGGGAGNQQPTPIKISDVKVGDGALGMGQMDEATKTLHAAMLIDTDASVLKAMRDNLGKTYITGRVTAVDLDNAKLTVERPDKVSQTIQLDESTSFRRRPSPPYMTGRGGPYISGEVTRGSAPAAAAAPAEGESITLADVKVGDNVMGTGEVKNGSFVPKQLTVMTPRQPGSQRPGEAAPAAPQAQK